MKQLPVWRAHRLRTFGAIVRSVVTVILSTSMYVAVGAGAVMTVSAGAEAKTPGRTYCFKGTCHRVKTIAETRREIGKVRVVYASHYDHCRRDRFNPCGLTSSGERFRPSAADNAASPIYPDGTRLLVWNPRNGKTVVVRINNAGPYFGRRKLDLSRGAAEKLGFRRRGVARLHVKVLSAPTRSEARYRRHRRYAPVPGFIGAFRSIDEALLSVGAAITGLIAGPQHVAARHETARQRRVRLAREERLRRVAAGSNRRGRSRRHSRRLPPPPISKLALARQPLFYLADAEMGRDAGTASNAIVLPARRPYRAVRIAAAPKPRTKTKRVALRKRGKAAERATIVSKRRRVAKIAKVRKRKLATKRVAVASKKRRVARGSKVRKVRTNPAKRIAQRRSPASAKRSRPATRLVRRITNKTGTRKRIKLAALAKKPSFQRQQKRKLITAKTARAKAPLQRAKQATSARKSQRGVQDQRRGHQVRRQSKTTPRASGKGQKLKAVASSAVVARRAAAAPVAQKSARPAPRPRSQAWRVGVARGGRER